MIFLTMGTYPLPFDRLVRAIDDLVKDKQIEDEVVAQISCSNYTPQYMKYVLLMEKEEFDATLIKADAIISHAGMGTVTMALEYNKPLLVMPRLKKFGELVNNHQSDTARKFEALGHILAAYSVNEIPEKLRELKSFIPQPRKVQTKAVADRIAKFLNEQDLSG